ncbi:MAG: site-specific integrase [Sphingobacteriaceae bacterium]|nr:site-specific integrase [Sphingobacteriaceae bacterium]
MQTKISILFFIKRSKPNASGLVPIYMRVTVGGSRIEISAKRFIEPSAWAANAGKVRQGSGDSKSVNHYLDMLKKQTYDYQTELIQAGLLVTAENMRNKLLGTELGKFSLIDIFQDHNDKMKALIGNKFAEGTHERYKTSLSHTVEFLKWKFKVSDIDIRRIDHAFITEYEFYLRSVKKCCNNTAFKYIKNFGKIIRICLKNQWIDKDPFSNYDGKAEDVDRVHLTTEELESVTNKVFQSQRLNRMRDLFVFSCFTGLAYSDIKKLNKTEVVKGIDGINWIIKNRQKTETTSRIPILPIAQEILDRYANDPQCKNTGKLLPVMSNQTMNDYVKEIGALCGIDKELTYHVARHTFATTVTLTNDVPMESLQKMLGHKDIKTTQHYGKIVDKKISNDMKLLSEKLSASAFKIVRESKAASS